MFNYPGRSFFNDAVKILEALETERINYENIISGYNQQNTNNILEITKVIFNNPATIVFWSDGDKTVVKCQEDDVFDYEKGIAMACAKKMFGNKCNYYNNLKRHIPEKVETETIFQKILKKLDKDEKGTIVKNILKKFEEARDSLDTTDNAEQANPLSSVTIIDEFTDDTKEDRNI
jgi:hypothetical protein